MSLVFACVCVYINIFIYLYLYLYLYLYIYIILIFCSFTILYLPFLLDEKKSDLQVLCMWHLNFHSYYYESLG